MIYPVVLTRGLMLKSTILMLNKLLIYKKLLVVVFSSPNLASLQTLNKAHQYPKS